MALKKPVPSERNRKDTDARAPKAEIDFDIAGPSSLTPKKPIPKQKKRKDTDGKVPEVPNTRSSSKRKWGNEEDKNPEKKHFKSDNGRRPGKKSDDMSISSIQLLF